MGDQDSRRHKFNDAVWLFAIGVLMVLPNRYEITHPAMHYEKCCLLIDDDHDDQLVFALIIEKLNKSIFCVTADNGLEALNKLEQDPALIPDVIFLDLNMPGLHGIDCLVRLKDNPKLAGIPVVIYTTSCRREEIKKAQSLGAVAFITKSYHIGDLTRKLNAFF